ncbi:MAG: class II aldolase/adducin family protein, partial [Pseudomonadota bacterium]
MSGGGLRTAAAFADLCAVSARLGQDPLQVQGAGGNTSIKAGGAMLVKASGTWLADALTRDVFVDVDAAGYAAALRAGRPEAADAMRFVRSGPTPGGLRPSIETGLHAALRAPVVLHTHCVATIAVAVQSGGAALALRALAGLDAVFVPYARPGIPLAEAMLAAGDDHGVYILGNHGLVVAADTVAAAAALQAEVTRRLAGPVARAPAKPLSLKGTGWAALGPGVPEQAAVLAGRALYPDHVIFLGPGIALPA